MSRLSPRNRLTSSCSSSRRLNRSAISVSITSTELQNAVHHGVVTRHRALVRVCTALLQNGGREGDRVALPTAHELGVCQHFLVFGVHVVVGSTGSQTGAGNGTQVRRCGQHPVVT